MFEPKGLENHKPRASFRAHTRRGWAHTSRAVTADTALRLARVLSTTPGLWLSLQQDVDLWRAERAKGTEIDAWAVLREAPEAGAEFVDLKDLVVGDEADFLEADPTPRHALWICRGLAVLAKGLAQSCYKQWRRIRVVLDDQLDEGLAGRVHASPAKVRAWPWQATGSGGHNAITRDHPS